MNRPVFVVSNFLEPSKYTLTELLALRRLHLRSSQFDVDVMPSILRLSGLFKLVINNTSYVDSRLTDCD